MKTCQLLSQLKELGIEVVAGRNGLPAIRPGSAASPKLLRVLKIHRAAIMEQLNLDPTTPPPPDVEEVWEKIGNCWIRPGLSEADRTAALRDIRFS